ncbi:alpha/beta hydrolase [bacterium]|nr:alpha/beta hydrolase [bacterium]
MLDWIPLTPVHFFHGEADLVVPIHNANTAYVTFNAAGAAVALTVYPGLTHETAGLSCIQGMLRWFESLH